MWVSIFKHLIVIKYCNHEYIPYISVYKLFIYRVCTKNKKIPVVNSDDSLFYRLKTLYTNKRDFI